MLPEEGVDVGRDEDTEDVELTLSRVLDLCESHRVPIPELGRFWNGGGAAPHRLFLWGPPGAGVDALLTRLTGAHLPASELRGYVVEVGPQVIDGWLYSDGSWECAGPRRAAVRLVAGHTFVGARVSAMLADGPVLESEVLDPDLWRRRVALVLILTPASAALGNLERLQLERLAAADSRISLLVTGLEGSSSEDRESYRKEIEDFKVRPLERSTGPLKVWFSVDVRRDEALVASLRQWIRDEMVSGHREALRRAVDECFEEVGKVLDERCRQEDQRREKALFLQGHGEDQVDRLLDLISQQRLGVENRTRVALKAVLEACFPLKDGASPSAKESFWSAVNDWQSEVRGLEGFESWVHERYRTEIEEFCAAHATMLSPFEVCWPEPEPVAPRRVPLKDLRSDVDAILERVGQSRKRSERGLGRWLSWLNRDEAEEDRLELLEKAVRQHLAPVTDAVLRNLSEETLPRVERIAEQIREAFQTYLAKSLQQDLLSTPSVGARDNLEQLRERWRASYSNSKRKGR